jgi:hypothetical protein
MREISFALLTYEEQQTLVGFLINNPSVDNILQLRYPGIKFWPYGMDSLVSPGFRNQGCKKTNVYWKAGEGVNVKTMLVRNLVLTRRIGRNQR